MQASHERAKSHPLPASTRIPPSMSRSSWPRSASASTIRRVARDRRDEGPADRHGAPTAGIVPFRDPPRRASRDRGAPVRAASLRRSNRCSAGSCASCRATVTSKSPSGTAFERWPHGTALTWRCTAATTARSRATSPSSRFLEGSSGTPPGMLERSPGPARARLRRRRAARAGSSRTLRSGTSVPGGLGLALGSRTAGRRLRGVVR